MISTFLIYVLKIEINLKEGSFWSVPIVGGYVPSPRCFFAFSGNQNELYGEVLVLGGKFPDN